MRVSKTYRFSAKTIVKLEAIAEKLNLCSTEIIEKAIEDFYNKEIKGLQCIPIDKYNEMAQQIQEANKIILELNNKIQNLLEEKQRLEYEKTLLEFKLLETEKKYKKLKQKIENVPFWRKDLGELFKIKDDED